MKLRQIVFSSPQHEMVAQLLGEVLDWPLTAIGDGIRVGREGEGALLFIKGKKTVFGESTLLDFCVESLEELQDLHQRWQFVRYRHTEQSLKQGEIVEADAACYFMIHDPDGRKWKFSFIKPG